MNKKNFIILNITFEEDKHYYSTSLFVCLFGLFAISWAAPEAYGSSQARGLIGAIAAGLHHSHSDTRSEPHLQSTPQLTAMLDP